MKFISRLNRRLGETIRNNVVIDIANGQFSGANKVNAAARVIAIMVVSTPYFVGATGITAIAFGFPSIPMLGIGAFLLGAAAYLRPRVILNEISTLTQSDAPTLLRLLDQISDALGAPKVSGVHVSNDFNAYVVEFNPQERVVGIGAPLWIALDPAERLAILAHEIAHLANNDPARGRLTGAAMVTLSRWLELFSPPSLIDHETNTEIIVDDRGIIAQIVSGLFGGAVGAIALSYEKLIFAESQRAEYLADIMAASVAGAPAMQSALKKIILAPLADDFVSRIYYDGSKELNMFEGMANAVRAPDTITSEKLYIEAAKILHSVDSSHPPTRYRIEVVGVAGQVDRKLLVGNIDWKHIDDELSSAFLAEEKNTLSGMLVQ